MLLITTALHEYLPDKYTFNEHWLLFVRTNMQNLTHVATQGEHLGAPINN